MTNHNAQFEQDPDTELREITARVEFLAARGVVSSSLSLYQAVNAAAIARKYPTMNPGIAGPIMIDGISYDSPSIGELAMLDKRKIEEDGWLVSGLKTGTRWAATVAEVPVRGYQQLGNTVVGMMQGRSFKDARRAAGSSILGEAMQQKALNPERPVNLGDGWLPESQLPWETDGFTNRFRDNLDGDEARIEESFQQTVAEALEEYGAPVTQRSYKELFSTPIHRTMRDGRQYVSNFSPINAMMNPIVGLQNPMTGHVILEPDDAIYQPISQWGQLATALIIDPLNVPLVTLPRMVQRSRFLPVQMSQADMFLAGTRGKRHWYNPGNGPDWLINHPKGKALVEYLTENTSIGETMRVLDLGTSDEAGAVYQRITNAGDADTVVRELMPHFGTKITETPRAHLGPSIGRPIQTMRTALGRAYEGPGGYTTRMDSILAKPFIRWGAKMTHGVLNGNDIPHTLHVINNYLRTINVPAAGIDRVLNTVVDNADISFTMGAAGRAVRKEVEAVLIKDHGAHADDVQALFGKWDETNESIRAYHTDNMGYPVRGKGTRITEGPDLVDRVPATRPYTAEEIAPQGQMRTSDLVGARRKAGATSDRQVRVGVAGLQEQSLGGSSYTISQGRKTWSVVKVGKQWELTGTGIKGGTQTYKTKKAAKAAIFDSLDDEARGLADLGASVADVGVQEKVVVGFHPESGQYRVLDGNKRVLAAEAAGLEVMPVEIREVGRRFVGQKNEAAALQRNTLSSKGQLEETIQTREPGDFIHGVDPMLEAEFMGDIYILPDQRDLRRMTSKFRRLRRVLGRVDADVVGGPGALPIPFGKIPLHQQSALGMFVDVGMARWREWQLIAVRWTFNVIPDELFRLSASGFYSPAYHPGQAMMWTFGNRGDLFLNGDIISDTLKASDLGAGYAQNLTEVAQRGYIGDVRRVPWIPFKAGAPGYYDAWATKVIHQWADPFSRKSLSMSRKDSFTYFTTDPDGIAIIDDIIKGSRGNTRLSQLRDPEILVDHIAQVEARAHQMAGGTWRAYDVNPQRPGVWTDSNGNVFPNEPPPKPGQPNWLIIQKGDSDLLDIMMTGRVKTGGTFVDASGRTMPATRAILSRGEETGGKLLATERQSRRQGMKQVEALRDRLKISHGKWTRREKAGVVSPKRPHVVRGQDPRLARRLDSAYKAFVDRAFAVLGQAPTMLLARNPFFKQVYWREMARGYVNATPEVRAVIKARAKQADVTIDLNKWIREEMKLAGYKELPTMPKGAGWDDVDLLNEWGTAVGLDKTKSLLYDLSESHNIVDMNRNIVVFAEAWWEIMSRWSNMLFNPQTRSFYNWEKGRQIGEFAQQNGFMSENEFEQTVFNYPSLGLNLLGTDTRASRLNPEITTQQLISNPLAQLGGGEGGAIRSVYAPGIGPIIQTLAPAFMSKLPAKWQQMFQQTLTGEFPLADSMLEQGFNSLPASYKNALTLIDAELGYTERRMANNTSIALEMLAVTGEYDMGDPDQQKGLETDAVTLGLTITVARLIDSLFAPESPRYVPQLLVDSMRLDQHEYIDAAAIGMAIDYAEELFRDPEAAVAYVADQYGLDPMNLMGIDLPKSRIIKQRPVTFEPFVWMQENLDFYDKYPFTAYIFEPDDPEADFFQPAWTDQFSNDTTQLINTEEQIAVFSNRQGSLKFNNSQNYADEQMALQIQVNPARRSGIEQDWRDWLQGRTLDIQAEHIGWSRSVFDINAHYTPGPATPEWGDLHDDFLRMVVRDDDGFIVGMEPDVMAADPITAEFIRGFMSTMDRANRDSVNRGHSEVSWLASTTGWATAWQNRIAEDTRTYVNNVRAAGGNTIGIEWVVRRWLNPLLKGTDMNTPFITDSGVGVAPVYRADDRIGEE